MYSSPPKHIGADLARSVERRIRLFRAQLTDEKIEMGSVAVGDSYASLVAFVDSKWFETLLARYSLRDTMIPTSITTSTFLNFLSLEKNPSDNLNPSDDLFLCELLDNYGKFPVVNYRHPKWSAVNFCLGCPACLQWMVCVHNTLYTMCFDPTLIVPTKWEQLSPSLRMA